MIKLILVGVDTSFSKLTVDIEQWLRNNYGDSKEISYTVHQIQTRIHYSSITEINVDFHTEESYNYFRLIFNDRYEKYLKEVKYQW